VPLEIELKFYNSIKTDLLRNHEGKFVLIIGEEHLGIFDKPEDAYEKGIELKGNVPMLIQAIEKEEKVETIPSVALGLINALSI
jgi:hypothetical protein